jgi:bifunctional enzyme CysN/CysC
MTSNTTGSPEPGIPTVQATQDGGVIWITGFSAAGKTTVGRKVKTLLNDRGVRAVILDGDDLRSIFGGKWGYERADRIELAHTYFRLCNTLAAQGVTVVISAVAMYEEVYAWVRTNVDRAMQVYLRVPEGERRQRDRSTKNVYASIGDPSTMYDEPSRPDLVIENYDRVSPGAAARQIVEAFVAKGAAPTDKGRAAHWNSYYSGAGLVHEPSNFATTVAAAVPAGSHIVEVGCGNGRDAVFFARSGHWVHGLDVSSAAIALCRKSYDDPKLSFAEGGLPTVGSDRDGTFDTMYTRFVLHAMTEAEEIATLAAAYRLLKSRGRIFIECRSINDPLARKGEVISPTERIHGHYRRFIILDDLKQRLRNAGFTIDSATEANNVAVLGDDNPVVIRIAGTKT